MIPVFGRYRVEAEYTRSSKTVLYRATDPETGREVAIKAIEAKNLYSPQARVAYAREIELIRAIQSPAVVPVLDYGESGDWVYIVMPWLPGGSLADRLAQELLTLEQASAVVARVALALGRCHAIGIVHGDIKPSNILFDAQGQAYVTDFGMLKFALSRLDPNQRVLVGPMGYSSPEQIQNASDRDGRSDIYMLGVLLFEMLTGNRPFPDGPPLTMALHHLAAPVPRLRYFRPEIPVRIESVVARAMAKDPNQRFSSVAEMTSALYSNLKFSFSTPQEIPHPFQQYWDIQPTLETTPYSRHQARSFRAGLLRLFYSSLGVIVIIFIGLYLASQWNPALSALMRPGQQHSPTPTGILHPISQLPSATFTADVNLLPTLTPNFPPSTPSPIPTVTEPLPTWTASSTAVPALKPTMTLPPPTPATTHSIRYNDRLFDLASSYGVKLEFLISQNQLSCTSSLITGKTIVIPPAEASYKNEFYQTLNWVNADGLKLLFELICMDEIRAIDFSPDGQILAVARQNDVYLWNTTGWKPLKRLTGHKGDINSLDFSPDGSMIITGSDDASVRIWSVREGKELKTFGWHTNIVTSVSFSPDGRLFASGSRDNTAVVTDIDGTVQANFAGNTVYSIAFSPDGALVAFGLVDRVQIYKVDNLTGPATVEFLSSNIVYSLRFSPDGILLASNTELWHLGEKRQIRHLADTNHQIGFTNDGQMVLLGGQMIRISNGLDVRILENPVEPINRTEEDWDRIALSPDGSLFAWGTNEGLSIWGFDQFKASALPDQMEFYTVQEGDTLYNIANNAGIKLSDLLVINSLECNSRLFLGQQLLLPGVNSSKLTSFEIPEEPISSENIGSLGEIHKLTLSCVDRIGELIFSNNSQLLITGSALWNLNTEAIILQEEVNELLDSSQPEPDLATPSLLFSPDSRLAAMRQGSQVWIWDVVTGRLLNRFDAHTDDVASLAFSSDGILLATSGGARDPGIKLWKVADGSPAGFLPGYAAWRMVFTLDGRLLIAFGKDSVRFWDLATFQQAYKGLSGLRGRVVVSPDTRHLAYLACEKTDLRSNEICPSDIVHIFRMADGKAILHLQGFQNRMFDFNFSQDGKYIATAAGNGVRLHRVGSTDILAEFYVPNSFDDLQRIIFDPLGRFLVTIDVKNRVRFWDLFTMKNVFYFDVQNPVEGLAFSPDSRLLAILANGQISLWGIR